MHNVKILIAFISVIFKFGQCASSIPYQFGQIAQIQSKTLWLTPTGTDNNFSCIYKRPKASSPPTTHVAWSFSELNYAVNDVDPTWTVQSLRESKSLILIKDFGHIKINTTVRKLSNGEICEQSIVENFSNEKLKMQKSQFDKGYQDSPFFIIPVQVIQQTKATLDLVQSSAQNKAKFRGKGNDLKELDIQINQEITLKTLKKEIKQKLLANKIQQKMVRLHQQREEKERDVGLKVPKIFSQSSANGFIYGQISSIDKKSASISIKQIKQQLRQQREKKIQHSDDADIGYIYTDTKVYNVYEEFDVI